jgi:hypothetical protein
LYSSYGYSGYKFKHRYIFILDEMMFTFRFIETISKSYIYVIYGINQINQSINFSTEIIIVLGICIIVFKFVVNCIVFLFCITWLVPYSMVDLQNVNKLRITNY